MNNGVPEPDIIINHLNQNHYNSDRSSDSEADHPSEPADNHKNHTASEPQDLRDRDEEENGRPRAGELQLGELQLGSEGGVELVLVEDQPPRYLSPAALKKHIHNETMKVNGELRALITKEIRKPGRRMYNKHGLLGAGPQNKRTSFYLGLGIIFSLILASMVPDYSVSIPKQNVFDTLF